MVAPRIFKLCIVLGIVVASVAKAADGNSERGGSVEPIDFTGQPMTYRLQDGDDQWPPEKRRQVVEAMNEAVALYNKYGEFPKAVIASYDPGVPTADGNYNGNIRFGGQISARVALHELGHVLGIGQHWRWNEFIKDGKWTGEHALKQLREFDGPEATLGADRMHFWPYGLNYDTEWSAEAARRHVLMVAAFRRDLGIVSRPIEGMIGVGTWETHAEFKDIRVTRRKEILFKSDFAKGLKGWKTHGGEWKTVNGALRQVGDLPETRTAAITGDSGWKDYTVTLKARKLEGNEGFLIYFGWEDENRYSHWNLGGWGNTLHGLDVNDGVFLQKPGHIETGRWYDIRIELKGPEVKAYLDGKLVQQARR